MCEKYIINSEGYKQFEDGSVEIPLDLPEYILDHLEEKARKEGVDLNDLIISIVMDNIEKLKTDPEHFDKFQNILKAERELNENK